MAFENFPYTDFHNLNLDWVLQTTKDLNEKWDYYYKEWSKWKDDVQNFIDNIDYIAEIDKYLDGLVDSGKMADIVESWIGEHYNVICIGDSYGEGYTPDGSVTSWTRILKNKYFTQQTVTESSEGGAGFANVGQLGHTFQDLLSEVAKKMSDQDRKRVRYIVCCGGWNDRGATTALVNAGIKKFCQVASESFPNATPYIGWVATPIVGFSTRAAHESYRRVKTLYETNFLKYKYLTNSDLALRWIGVLSSDNIHPNAVGQASIADCVYKAINGGCTVERDAYFNVKGENCLLNLGQMYLKYSGHFCNISIDDSYRFLDFAFTSPIKVSNSSIKVMTHTATFLNERGQCMVDVVIHEKTKGKYTSTRGLLTINPFDAKQVDAGSVYLKVVDATVNGYVTYEDVDEIQVYGVDWNVVMY